MKHKLGIILTALTAVAPALIAAPEIASADRTVQFPSPSTAIPFSAVITDAESALNGVTLYVDTSYPSSPGTVAFAPHTMTLDAADTWIANIPGAAEGTYVKWYIEATNAASETTRYPAAADSFNTFLVTTAPIDVNDIIINELIADPQGGDNSTNSEWFEIYNRTGQEIDLSHYFFGNYPTGPNARAVGEGTTIAPNGYLIFAANKSLFTAAYPSVDSNIVYDVGWTSAVLPNNGGATNNVFFAHPNERGWEGSTVPFAHVPYINGQGDWPSWTTTNSNAVSFQLAAPGYDISDGWNWNMSSLATPGAPNRVIAHAGPVQRYAAPSTAIAFEADVESWGTGVTLHYRLHGETAFTDLAFTAPGSGLTWTATIPGGFPDRSIVEWYVTATAPEGTVHYPFSGENGPLQVLVTSTTPVADTVVINELVYDPQGGDNNAYPEWTELYNPGTSPVDLSGVIFGRNLNIGDAGERILPAGTIIQPGGYLVLAGNYSLFRSIFSSVPSDIVVDLQWGTSSMYNNTAGAANLRYPGGNLRDGGTLDYIDQVPYMASAPWPSGTNNNGGATIELINPVLDNSQPHNWRTSIGDTFAGANRGTPGYQNSTYTTDIEISIIGASRNIQYPVSADDIIITAEINVRESMSAARVHVATSASGPFTAHDLAATGTPGEFSANIGKFSSGTYVFYYIEAVSGSTTKLHPEGAPDEKLILLVDDGTPVGSDDLAFNEIQADPQSTDNGASSEWVEIMNLRDTPVDVSYFVFSPKTAIGSDAIVIPEGTVIPARGFLLVVGNKPLFESEYLDGPFTFDDNLVIGAEGWEGRSALTNGANNVSFRHVNAWGYTGAEGDPIDEVRYDTAATGTGNNGLTAELLKPGVPNYDTANWAASLIKGGTPGAPNSQYRPVLMSIGRDKEFPTPTETIIFSVDAEAADEALDVDTVTLHIAENGGTYNPFPMTRNLTTNMWETAPLGSFPNGTVLSFYAIGADTNGDTSAFPIPYADHHFDLIVTEDGNHVGLGDVVVNEILYDNVGADQYEFIELYNTTNSPIDLSHFRVTDNELRPVIFPQGTIIPGDGYIILTMDSFIFRTRYGNPPAEIFSWNGQFNLANGGDIIRLVHPNQYRVHEVITPTEHVEYDTIEPWPFWSITEDGPNVTGRSIELINPRMADRGTNGNAWAWTTNVVLTEPSVMGTPGVQNSVYNPTASVNEWTLY